MSILTVNHHPELVDRSIDMTQWHSSVDRCRSKIGEGTRRRALIAGLIAALDECKKDPKAANPSPQ